MVSVNDLRTGLTIELDGQVWSVVEFLHVKPGKGAAFVRTKLKNVRTGAVQERTFRGGERVPRAHVETRTMEYLYTTGEDYVFMDSENYDQLSIPGDKLEDTSPYLKPNMSVSIQFYHEEPIGVELPTFVELEVVETDPGVRGDTATGGTKPAKLETGLTVQVPLFVETGQLIRVDTRTGEYLSRV